MWPCDYHKVCQLGVAPVKHYSRELGLELKHYQS